MAIIVQKYGGSSVRNLEQIENVAKRVVTVRERGDNVVVVVSAMGNTTNELLKMAHQVTNSPDRRELDMLLSCGERITMALLSMMIKAQGHDAISFTGSQCGIMTNDNHFNARIVEVRPFRIQDELEKNRVVIVAGYQGTSYRREVTTLGRGGSDTTAVALAAALGAKACEIYSDVNGVYSGNPKIVPPARLLAHIDYDEMEELARCGAKVLNQQAVEFARRAQIAIFARAGNGSSGETIIRKDLPGASGRVLGITGRTGLSQLDVEMDGQDPNCLERVLSMAANSIPCLAHHQTSRASGSHCRLLLLPDSEKGLLSDKLKDHFGASCKRVELEEDLCTVSVVGHEVGGCPESIACARKALVDAGLDYRELFLTPLSITFVTHQDHFDLAQQALHRELIESKTES